jgi:uncharacterized protein (TIGR02391 family)
MLKGNKKNDSAATCIHSLWEEGFFKDDRTLKNASMRISEKWGHNFTSSDLSKALTRAEFLIRKGKRQSFKYIQKISATESLKKVREDRVVISYDLLHPLIKKVSSGLFEDGHYSQAIFETYKAVVNAVKNVSGMHNLDGKSLMERVFSLGNPIVKFNNLQTQSEKDEQIGLMLLFSGASLGIRNPKAHDNVVQKDRLRTLEYLSFASLLLKRLDERVK